MDGGRESRFLAGGAEISRRGGGITAAPVHHRRRPAEHSRQGLPKVRSEDRRDSGTIEKDPDKYPSRHPRLFQDVPP